MSAVLDQLEPAWADQPATHPGVSDWLVDLGTATATHPCGLKLDFVPLSQSAAHEPASKPAIVLDTCGAFDAAVAWAVMASPDALDRALRYFASTQQADAVRQVCVLTRQACSAWARACARARRRPQLVPSR